MKCSWGGQTHRGKKRRVNQDRLLMEPDIGLFGVFDGMGGPAGGEVAAQLAHDTVIRFLRKHIGDPALAGIAKHTLLQLAIDTAGGAVYAAALARKEYREMGTTVVACLETGDGRVVIAHAGDSRAYLLRSDALSPLTQDHTLVQELIDRGQLTQREALESPLRHVLSRNLGAQETAWSDTVDHTLEPGDRILLCTDGLYNALPADAMRQIAGSNESTSRIAELLADAAASGGADDDIGVVVLAW
jgi:serine/threonine protein phosphatase PrpC